MRVRVAEIQLRNPRQFGACWLALHLWNLLALDAFFEPRLPPSRKRTRWANVLKALVAYRLIDPGSEFRLHRQGYLQSSLADLLGEDSALAQKDKLYRCLDLLAPHREALFEHLTRQWGELFEAQFDVLLDDLTSTYFRVRSAAARGQLQTPFRLQPRSSSRLHAGRRRAGRHARRTARRLRSLSR